MQASSSAVLTGACAIPNWSFSYKGGGGTLLINISATACCNLQGLHSLKLLKNGTIVAGVGVWTFTASGTHLTQPQLMYIDTSGSTATNNWSLSIESGLQVDSNDFCTAVILSLIHI